MTYDETGSPIVNDIYVVAITGLMEYLPFTKTWGSQG